MPIQLKAALITLVIGTCLADLVVILAHHTWFLPYLGFTLASGGALTVIYLIAAEKLAEAEAEKAEAAENARRARA